MGVQLIAKRGVMIGLMRDPKGSRERQCVIISLVPVIAEVVVSR